MKGQESQQKSGYPSAISICFFVEWLRSAQVDPIWKFLKKQEESLCHDSIVHDCSVSTMIPYDIRWFHTLSFWGSLYKQPVADPSDVTIQTLSLHCAATTNQQPASAANQPDRAA